MKQAKDIVSAINDAQNIVITSHKSPDGDSIGSSLGLLRFIEALGKKAVIAHPDPCPDFLNWVKKDAVIIDFESNPEKVAELLENADLIFSLDYNAPNRLGKDMGALLSEATAKKIVIDHHLDPDDFADILVSEPSVCSTAQLVFEFIEASGNSALLNAAIAEPIYLGMMTDTGSFRFDSVSPRTHEILSQLLSTGLNHTKVHENTFDGNRLDKLKLRGYAIAEKLELLPEYKLAIISLSQEELQRFNYIKGDTEGLVNIALSVEGVETAVFLSEKDDAVKMSFRSKGAPVNIIAAEEFDGGGHKFAAGGISYASLDATIDKLKSVVPKYF